MITWFRAGRRIDWSRVLLLALALAVVVTVGYVGATSEAAFAPYNPAWDGASDLRSVVDDDPTVDARYITDTAAYGDADPSETVAFVIAPTDAYGPDDAAAVRSFVEDGGTLVIMENFGTAGDELLADVGAEARFDSRVVRDERHHFAAPTMPIATDVTDHERTADVQQLTLNYATAIEPGEATMLVRTSDYAYLVADAEEVIDDEDELAALPVVTVERIGDGEVIAVADPSLAINVMLAEPDNARFLTNQWAGSDQVLFDLSHAAGLPLLTAVTLAIRGSPLIQAIVGVLAVVLSVGLAHRWEAVTARLRSSLPGRLGPSPAETTSVSVTRADRAAYLRRHHPEWDPARIDRVIAALNREDREIRQQ